MVTTRTPAWHLSGTTLRATIEPLGLQAAGGAFFPDHRVDASPADPDFRLTETPSGFALAVREPLPGRVASSVHPTEADALRAFGLGLSERFAWGTGDALRLHAAGAVIGGGAVLLVGPSGSGKSTLAAALGLRGHALLGDDMVPIDRGTRLASPFRRLLKVEGPGAGLLGWRPPRGPAAPFWPEVSLIHPRELGSRWADPAPVRLVVFPRRPPRPAGSPRDPLHGEPRRGAPLVEPLSPSAALEILLRERVFPGEPARDFELLAEILNVTGPSVVLTCADAREGAREVEELVLERVRAAGKS